MNFTLHNELETGAEPVLTRVEDFLQNMEARLADLASDSEVNHLQTKIDSMNAAAQRLENEIAQMMGGTGGQAQNTTQFNEAKQALQSMHCAADSAKAALCNAPTDPKTGRKLISSKKITNLASGMLNLIVAGEGENAKVEAAAVETRAREEANEAKGAHPVAKAPLSLTKCAHAAVCALTGASVAPKRSWFGEQVEEARGFGARVSQSIVGRWNGFTASVSSVFSGIVNSDPVAKVEHFANDVWEGAKDKVNVAVTAVHGIAHSAKVQVVAAVSVVKEKLHAGKVMVANAIDSINIFKAKPAVVEAHAAHAKPHGPIKVQPGVMEKAIAEAKALIPHSLPHISLPNISEFIPTSLPSLQGVMGELAHMH